VVEQLIIDDRLRIVSCPPQPPRMGTQRAKDLPHLSFGKALEIVTAGPRLMHGILSHIYCGPTTRAQGQGKPEARY